MLYIYQVLKLGSMIEYANKSTFLSNISDTATSAKIKQIYVIINSGIFSALCLLFDPLFLISLLFPQTC